MICMLSMRMMHAYCACVKWCRAIQASVPPALAGRRSRRSALLGTRRSAFGYGSGWQPSSWPTPRRGRSLPLESCLDLRRSQSAPSTIVRMGLRSGVAPLGHGVSSGGSYLISLQAFNHELGISGWRVCWSASHLATLNPESPGAREHSF